jgi:flagellar hook-length control protein FliK
VSGASGTAAVVGTAAGAAASGHAVLGAAPDGLVSTDATAAAVVAAAATGSGTVAGTVAHPAATAGGASPTGARRGAPAALAAIGSTSTTTSRPLDTPGAAAGPGLTGVAGAAGVAGAGAPSGAGVTSRQGRVAATAPAFTSASSTVVDSVSAPGVAAGTDRSTGHALSTNGIAGFLVPGAPVAPQAGPTGAGQVATPVAADAGHGAAQVDPTLATAAAAVGHGPLGTAAPAAASSPAPAAPVVAPSLAQQLAPSLQSLRSLGNGQHVMTIDVTPEHLGPVRVTAHISADGVRIDLVGATAESRDALRQSMTDLKRDLAGAGLQADLSLGSGAPGSDGWTGRSQGQAGAAAARPAPVPSASVAPETEAPTRSPIAHAGALDLSL